MSRPESGDLPETANFPNTGRLAVTHPLLDERIGDWATTEMRAGGARHNFIYRYRSPTIQDVVDSYKIPEVEAQFEAWSPGRSSNVELTPAHLAPTPDNASL